VLCGTCTAEEVIPAEDNEAIELFEIDDAPDPSSESDEVIKREGTTLFCGIAIKNEMRSTLIEV
jgi:hypothetical protein